MPFEIKNFVFPVPMGFFKGLKPSSKCGCFVLIPAVEAWKHVKGRVMVAHQPGFHHLGIMVKFLVATVVSPHGFEEVIVDSDEGEVSFLFPFERDGHWSVEKFTLSEGVFENIFIEPERARSFNRFVSKLTGLKMEAGWFPEVYVSFRNKWMRLPSQVSYLSYLCRSEEFAAFVEDVFKHWDKFSRVFNKALEEFGKLHRVRGRLPIRPVGDETPFWVVEGARRTLLKREKWEKFWKKGVLRPKAITLTLFLRKKCDLFIHGIGGAKYDEITDYIACRMGWKLAPYGVVSATFFWDPSHDYCSKFKKYSELKFILKDFQWNPDRYIDVKESYQKRELVRLKSKFSPQDFHRRVMELNRLIQKKGEGFVSDLNRELEELKKYLPLFRRDFPFFIFDPVRIFNMVKTLFDYN